MPDGGDKIAVKVLAGLGQVSAEQWDACAGDDNPFVSHAFLSALEDSDSATAATGWMAQHLAIEDESGRLAAALPLYLKDHSYGEYVFDWGWAEAYERAGGRYYPKLQCSVPFTPVTGPRLLVRADVERGGVERSSYEAALIAGVAELARRLEIVTVHVTFPRAREWEALGAAGFLQRSGRQYHWNNEGYESFDAFLAALASRKRKAIRKERQAVAAAGVTHRWLCGDDIKARHWDLFYRFYRATSDRKWGEAYLTREFFTLLGERLGERAVLILAEMDGATVAGALNLKGREALYGRNWGTRLHLPFLHFETCYYQAIDFAIAHGLRRVEAGAQGEHKVQRGYLPVPTYSAHLIRDPGFARAVERFLTQERREIEREIEALAEFGPFRRGLVEASNSDKGGRE
ncbi:MAG: GNAT family N-acetyltransferase [Kiloniellales bacterium]